MENTHRVYLYPYEYEQLYENAEDTRARLAVRLGGEVGLRIGETARTKIEHIEYLERDDGEVTFLYVPEYEPTTQTREKGRPRSIFLPNRIEELINEYAEKTGIGPSDELFPVVKRTVQEYVKRAAQRTAEATGNEDFKQISSQDLRAFFAKNMVENHRVHPEVVRKMGGWKAYKPMGNYLNEANEDLVVKEYRNAGIE